MALAIFRKFLSRFSRPNPEECDHAWVVFGTTHSEVALEVQCKKCLLVGTVPDPDEAEWSEAFDALENPYPWKDNSRVHPAENLIGEALQRLEKGEN